MSELVTVLAIVGGFSLALMIVCGLVVAWESFKQSLVDRMDHGKISELKLEIQERDEQIEDLKEQLALLQKPPYRTEIRSN